MDNADSNTGLVAQLLAELLSRQQQSGGGAAPAAVAHPPSAPEESWGLFDTIFWALEWAVTFAFLYVLFKFFWPMVREHGALEIAEEYIELARENIPPGWPLSTAPRPEGSEDSSESRGASIASAPSTVAAGDVAMTSATKATAQHSHHSEDETVEQLRGQLKRVQERELAARQHLLATLDGQKRNEDKMNAIEELQASRDAAVAEQSSLKETIDELVGYTAHLETALCLAKNQLHEALSNQRSDIAAGLGGSNSEGNEASMMRHGSTSARRAHTLQRRVLTDEAAGAGATDFVPMSVHEAVLEENDILRLTVEHRDQQARRMASRLEAMHAQVNVLEQEVALRARAAPNAALAASGDSPSTALKLGNDWGHADHRRQSLSPR